jgi:2-polyprenyl-3-methyl-5-hydroxy-6-metoxy-1,4-benzoquinol methylase
LAGSVVGTDISHEMLELATKKLADHPNVRIAELEDVPRYSFDLALCSSVIEYAEDDELFLKNVASYVAPRGYLIITFPNRTGVLQLMQRYLMSRFHPDSYIHFQKNTYTDRSIRVLLERAGLQALQLYAPIGFPGLRRIGLGELLLCVARKPA